MKRHQLNDITIFVEVARCNGFRAAAEKLKMGPGSVSEAIQRFEDRLGARLFDRSTRTVALTAAGEELYRRSMPAIDELTNVISEIDEQANVVAGTLRLNAPRSASSFFLNELLIKYARAYPEVKIELTYNDKKIDLVANRIDVSIRSEPLLGQDTYALPIGLEMPMAVVASPDYFKIHGIPKHPNELIHHSGICFSFEDSATLAPWKFTGNNGDYSVTPKPHFVVNDFASMLDYALAGLGLTYIYAKPIEKLIKEQRLVSVLKQHISPQPQFSINYVSKRHMPARLRAFINLAKEHMYR